MLVETWIAVPLRRRSEIVLPSGWYEGVTNWLLEGAWSPAVTEPEISLGGAAARLHKVLKEIDPHARVSLADGALEPLQTAAERAPEEGLEAVPEPWTQGLVEGTARATLRFEGLIATIEARYASRTRAHIPPLRIIARGIREELLPKEEPDPSYASDIDRALLRPDGFSDLRELLFWAGNNLGKRIGEGFSDLVASPCGVKTQVRVFERVDGLEDLLRGFPPGAARHIAATGRFFLHRRPVAEVTRRDISGEIALWRGEPDEVSHGR